ncbi:MAG: DNA mismatch repair endonuclease MutL [Myxococcota bacterium]|nr:DNA mismatch repair endonuclease MutL [Myxococcota bacterium]
MGRIRRLPSHLANQIAAGEVVERPASIVKELVENALDAGASRINVDIEQGGTALVRVSDDGAGMCAEDALLAMERHATSKIEHKDDLFRLQTFGFRGEALPSIASVGKLRMVTRERGSAEALEVVVEGGQAAKMAPAGAAEGTSVELRDLFFNVPARRKFLKSTGTEAAHVSEAILLSALARPNVSFFLTRDGRPAREWLRVPTRRERAAQAFEGERLQPCLGERGPLKIEAHLAAPQRSRAGTVGLHLLVNGRPVRDRQLARAIAQAYGSVLEPGRYPVGVAYVDLPTDQVDVNVHPQKAEVRFADARSLFDALTRELHAGLANAFSLPSLGSSRAWFPPPSRSYTPGDFAAGPYRTPAPFGSSGEPGPDPWGLASGAEPPPPAVLAERTTMRSPAPPAFDNPSAPSEEGLFDGPGFYGSLQFLAQVRATFLVCSGTDGLYVLDQHAAAERVTFHALQRAFSSRAIATQQLLIPELVELLPAEMAVIEERARDVAALGVELRAVGTNAVAVHGIPTLLLRGRPERIVRDLVAELGRASVRPFGDAADLVLATMACHGSIRAGDAISREEAGALLRALDDVDFGGHCPHGRPVVTRIGFDELDRRVGR